MEFVDIAGLVRGASKGEGLGNKFLANIRETDAICQVGRWGCSPKSCCSLSPGIRSLLRRDRVQRRAASKSIGHLQVPRHNSTDAVETRLLVDRAPDHCFGFECH